MAFAPLSPYLPRPGERYMLNLCLAIKRYSDLSIFIPNKNKDPFRYGIINPRDAHNIR